jgi:hypothetical protein
MRTSATLRYLIGPIELLHEQAGPGLLRLARLGIFALWIVKLLLDPLWRLAELPRDFFRPTGILALLPATSLDALLTPHGLTAFLCVTLVVLVLGLLPYGFPVVSTFAALLLTAYSSLIRSFGPPVHTDIVLLLSVYALCAFSWADWIQAKIGKRDRAENAWSSYPLITIVAMLCTSYCLVGLNRTISGGISVFTGDTMEAWAIDASLRGYYFNTNVGWHIPEWPAVVFLLWSGLPVVTLLEILAPLCLAWPHFRWIFIPFMLSFHLLSLIFMNIFFFDDMLVYLLLIDWSRKYPGLRTHDRASVAMPSSPLASKSV